MENIKQSISYLKGLMEGMELDCDKKETKVLYAVLDVLDVMSEEMDDLQNQGQYCEEIIDDMLDGGIADEFQMGDFGESDFADEFEENQSVYEDMDEVFVEVTCPHCQALVDFEKATYENSESLICPNCIQLIQAKGEE